MARHPELLIPASSLEVLKTAVVFGADAVYIGGEAFGLRAKAKNFSKEDMMEGIRFAHEHDVKVYVTANILAHNYDLEGVREYFKELKEIKPDALIIADPGVFEIAKEVCPEIERHVSTQANNTNYATYMFWYRQGASRVVSARELSMREIKEIRAHIPDDLEIETLRSTDAGVAFYVKTNGASFYHAGDLNNWKWDGAGELVNGIMDVNYKNQIKKLAKKDINLAFVPFDPKLGMYQSLGMEYFLEHTNAEYVFPMHMWQDYSGIQPFIRRLSNQAMADRIVPIVHENQVFEIREE